MIQCADTPVGMQAPPIRARDFPFTTLPGLFRFATGSYSRADALNYPGQSGWLSWSHARFAELVRHLALGLVDTGLRKGEPVGLTCPSSPPWLMVDLAVQIAGGVTVPFFRKICADSFRHQVRDSSIRLLFAGNPQDLPPACRSAADLVELVGFWYTGCHPRFEDLIARGQALDRREPRLFEELCEGVAGEDLATILYTSGTTGQPRAVELTQANIVSQVRGCAIRFPADPSGDVCLSALPLDHIFERMVMYYYVAAGLPVYFVDDPANLARCLGQVRPTIMTAVPRILEKVAHRFEEAAAATRGIRGLLARSAIARAASRDVNKPGRGLLDALYRKTVYPRLTQALGGRLRLLMSGSAKLQPEVARLLINVGVPVYEGYGLTEASPVIAASYFGRQKPGAVGPLFPGVEVRIAEDGEILARGPNIMRGYHGNPQATAEAITPEGWLHTGDLGSLDAEGFLAVERRKKELFKKSTGEYVPPVPIERALQRIPIVDAALVVADNRPCVVALLFPDPPRLAELRQRSGLTGLSDEEFLHGDFLKGWIQDWVDRINAHLQHCERVERFVILDHPASVENGELSATLKPRRFFIEQKYRGLIEGMYRCRGE